MQPPFDITPKIIHLISSISEKIGEVNASYLNRPSTQLRKQNRIKTIHSSLKIEGNTLTEEQITALLEKKRIVGPKKDVTEVLNAIDIYENLKDCDPTSQKSFLKAHKTLMTWLVDAPGKYRTKGRGIVKGSKVAHVAPPAQNVPYLMNALFAYLKKSDEIELISSCVFHYELEFIHPFLDGNGRMGRLWQTILLMKKYPVFEFLPFETLISKDQATYYKALSDSDKEGKSTLFITYMLEVIDQSVGELLTSNNSTFNEKERLRYFLSLSKREFTRKDYMAVFKEISTATASRDLKNGVEQKLFNRVGEKNKTKYTVI
jgi:Fic family protein